MRCAQAARVTPKRLDGLLHDARAFLFRELRECLVFEARDGVALVVIADPAFERRETAAGVVAQFALQRRDVERRLAEAEFARSSARHRRNEHDRVARLRAVAPSRRIPR